MSWGSSEYASSEYGGALSDFGLVSATTLNPTSVRLTFSKALKTEASTVDTGNYSIPGLTVLSVTHDTPTTVVLTTSAMSFTVYTVTVAGAVRNTAGETLDPDADTATFSGATTTPQLIAAAQSRIKVQLVFSTDMLIDTALSNPTNYTVSDFNGNLIDVIDVDLNGLATVRRVTLHLDSELEHTGHYRVTVSPDVKSITGVSLNPSTARFTWVETPLTRAIPIERFTGELRGGLFGNPEGLVFFSPSLAPTAVANSSLQVDEVSVCTRAYDEYVFPELPDPTPFYTFGSGGPGGTLNTSGMVLWSNFNNLTGFRHKTTDKRADTVPTAVDGKCTATLRETYDVTKVSLLNSTYWSTYNGGAVGVQTFKTADNSAPVTAGGTTVIAIVP